MKRFLAIASLLTLGLLVAGKELLVYADQRLPGLTDSPGGVAVYPGDNIQDSVDAYPAGTTFTLLKGVHRIRNDIEPLAGNVFVGQDSAILSGAVIVADSVITYAYAAGDTNENGVALWSALADTAFTSAGDSTVCGQPGTAGLSPGCYLKQDLFFDDAMLFRTTSKESVISEDRWFLDVAKDTLYFLANPWGHKVELSISEMAFRARVDSVTIKNLVIEKFCGQNAAVFTYNYGDTPYATHWVIDDGEIRLNSHVGLGVGPYYRVTDNFIHHNGRSGMTGFADSAYVRNNEIAYNNTMDFSVGNEAGAFKFNHTRACTIVSNDVHNNFGHAIWLDGDNIYSVIDSNTVDWNWAAGIKLEIGWDAVVRYNMVRHNAQGWAGVDNFLFAGISAQNNANVTVHDNVVTNNAVSIFGYHASRGTSTVDPHSGDTFRTESLSVYDNACTTLSPPKFANPQTTWGVVGVHNGGAAADSLIYDSWGNSFQSNDYIYPSGPNHDRWRWDGAYKDSTEWLATGNDSLGGGATFDPQ